MLHWPGLSLAAAVRARALVATAAGARLADHGSILSGIHLLAGGSFPDAKNNAQCSLTRQSVVMGETEIEAGQRVLIPGG
jgi:hypothetical protein